jgi:hypothetical protein
MKVKPLGNGISLLSLFSFEQAEQKIGSGIWPETGGR